MLFCALGIGDHFTNPSGNGSTVFVKIDELSDLTNAISATGGSQYKFRPDDEVTKVKIELTKVEEEVTFGELKNGECFTVTNATKANKRLWVKTIPYGPEGRNAWQLDTQCGDTRGVRVGSEVRVTRHDPHNQIFR